jgi:hypothetical protein
MICAAILLTACSLPSAPAPTPTLDLGLVSTIAAMTLEAIPSRTPFPSPSLVVLTVTPTLTVTITPTYETPMLQFSGNTNCRTGPGTEYEVTTVVLSGQKAQAVGVSQTGNYWLIKIPGGEDCWVAKDFVQASGSIQALPTVMSPPTPSPVPPNAPAWAAYNFTCDFASGGNNITMNMSWSDRASNEEGYVIYRDDQPVVTLPADSTSYVDVAFAATGKSLSYRVEAFSKAGRASSSTIQASCQ